MLIYFYWTAKAYFVQVRIEELFINVFGLWYILSIPCVGATLRFYKYPITKIDIIEENAVIHIFLVIIVHEILVSF